jgi:hypothetical protein
VDTAVSLVNDLLLSIRTPIVRVIVEDGEAVSITSNRYAEFSDLEILRMCEPFGIASVSRTDWFMRVYTQIGYRTEPVPGDVCGFGFNIFNSETGFRPVSVEHYVLRYICSNGAVVKQTGGHAGRSHHGHSPEELRRFVAARLEHGTRAREDLVQNIRKSAGTAATEEERFRLSRELRRNATYTRELRDLIEQASTRYDLFNLATAIARPLPPPQRLRLEEFAGGMMR